MLNAPLSPLQRWPIFEMMPIPAFMQDTTLVFTHANQAFCMLAGIARTKSSVARSPT